MKSRNGLAKEQFSFFWRWQQRRCYLCRGRMAHPAGSSGRARLSATTDHTRPHCSGGRRRSNLVLAHRGCNERKGDRAPTACEVFFATEAWSAYETRRVPRQLSDRSWRASDTCAVTQFQLAFARAEQLRQSGRAA